MAAASMPVSFTVTLALGLGGAAGALLRYGVMVLAAGRFGLPAWLGTMLINIAGCFAIGYLWSWLDSSPRGDWMRPLLVTGFLGAFTTFSAFGIESLRLLEDRKWAALACCVGGSVVLGLCAVRLGMVCRGGS